MQTDKELTKMGEDNPKIGRRRSGESRRKIRTIEFEDDAGMLNWKIVHKIKKKGRRGHLPSGQCCSREEPL